MEQEHYPGRVVKRENDWQVICACGDEHCAEEWDYSVPYLMKIPAGLTVEDLPWLKVQP